MLDWILTNHNDFIFFNVELMPLLDCYDCCNDCTAAWEYCYFNCCDNCDEEPSQLE